MHDEEILRRADEWHEAQFKIEQEKTARLRMLLTWVAAVLLIGALGYVAFRVLAEVSARHWAGFVGIGGAVAMVGSLVGTIYCMEKKNAEGTVFWGIMCAVMAGLAGAALVGS